MARRVRRDGALRARARRRPPGRRGRPPPPPPRVHGRDGGGRHRGAAVRPGAAARGHGARGRREDGEVGREPRARRRPARDPPGRGGASAAARPALGAGLGRRAGRARRRRRAPRTALRRGRAPRRRDRRRGRRHRRAARRPRRPRGPRDRRGRGGRGRADGRLGARSGLKRRVTGDTRVTRGPDVLNSGSSTAYGVRRVRPSAAPGEAEESVMRWGGPDEVTLKPPERAAAKRSGPEPDAAGPERESGATLVADTPAESAAEARSETPAEARTEAPAPRRSPENDPAEAAPDVERSPDAAEPDPGQRSETTRAR